MYKCLEVIGRLTKRPELFYTVDGKPVCKFTVALNEDQKSYFFDVVTFSKLAENCSKYLYKGRPVFVKGNLEKREWKDKEENTQVSWQIIGSKQTPIQVVFLPNGTNSNSASSNAHTDASQSSGFVPEIEENDVPM